MKATHFVISSCMKCRVLTMTWARFMVKCYISKHFNSVPYIHFWPRVARSLVLLMQQKLPEERNKGIGGLFCKLALCTTISRLFKIVFKSFLVGNIIIPSFILNVKDVDSIGSEKNCFLSANNWYISLSNKNNSILG